MKNKIQKYLLRFVIISVGFLSIFITLYIFGYIFNKGAGIISFRFLTQKLEGLPLGTEGGIFPAIVGSLLLGLLSIAIGGGLGIFGGIYLFFYKKSKFNKLFELLVTILSGIPSIIFGLVGYNILIFLMDIKKSILTASITVGVMIIPFVAIRASKIFDEKARVLLISSYSLGISKEYTLIKMILPNCFSELAQTLAIAMAYGMGAVAPIMYTGVVMNTGLPKGILEPFMSLPYHLYMLVVNGISEEYAYGTAFVLLFNILVIQIISKLGKEEK